MIRCAVERGADGVRATFAVPDDHENGRIVAVVGDFNGWDPAATPMRKQGNERVATVTVDAGRRYAFRYLADDGGWINDDDADGYERGLFGEDNSILDLSGGS